MLIYKGNKEAPWNIANMCTLNNRYCTTCKHGMRGSINIGVAQTVSFLRTFILAWRYLTRVKIIRISVRKKLRLYWFRKILSCQSALNLHCFHLQLLLSHLYSYIPFGESKICAELKTFGTWQWRVKFPMLLPCSNWMPVTVMIKKCKGKFCRSRISTNSWRHSGGGTINQLMFTLGTRRRRVVSCQKKLGPHYHRCPLNKSLGRLQSRSGSCGGDTEVLPPP
jgi:hypothetical protein